MAKSSSSDDNNVEEDDEDDDDESFHKKGLMVLNALPKNKNAHAILFEIIFLKLNTVGETPTAFYWIKEQLYSQYLQIFTCKIIVSCQAMMTKEV